MSLLKGAFRRILYIEPQFALMKQNHIIPKDDLFKVVRFIKGSSVVQQKDNLHIQEMITDKTILKQYLSTDTAPRFQYLALMQLGVEFLSHHQETEELPEAHDILYGKIIEERKKL